MRRKEASEMLNVSNNQLSFKPVEINLLGRWKKSVID